MLLRFLLDGGFISTPGMIVDGWLRLKSKKVENGRRLSNTYFYDNPNTFHISAISFNPPKRKGRNFLTNLHALSVRCFQVEKLHNLNNKFLLNAIEIMFKVNISTFPSLRYLAFALFTTSIVKVCQSRKEIFHEKFWRARHSRQLIKESRKTEENFGQTSNFQRILREEKLRLKIYLIVVQGNFSVNWWKLPRHNNLLEFRYFSCPRRWKFSWKRELWKVWRSW